MKQEQLVRLKAVLDKTLDNPRDAVDTIRRVRKLVDQKPQPVRPRHVIVDNQAPVVESVTVSNLKDLQIPAPVVNTPDEVTIRKGWLSESVGKLVDLYGGMTKQLERMVFRVKLSETDPTKPVAVRISNGKRFIDVLTQAVATANRVAFPFKDTTGAYREALVDTDGKLQVELTSTDADDWVTNHIDDYTTTNVTYIGKEKADGTWWFQKIDETGNFPIFTHASVGNNAAVLTYSDAYASRTTLTYNLYEVAF